MPTFNSFFPVLPGKEDAARSFGKELNGGPRRDQLEDLERRCGVDCTFTELGTGTDEFTTWHRRQVREIGGLDLATDEQPPSEVIFAWSAA